MYLTFHDYSTKLIKKLDPIPEGFILPRIGEYVSFNEKKDWIVTDIYHCYESDSIMVHIDDFHIYEPVLIRKPGK